MSLTAGRLRTLEAFADTLLPADEVQLPSGQQSGVVPLIDRLLESFPAATRAQIAVLLSALEISPLLSLRFRSRFSNLRLEDRETWVIKTLTEGSYPAKVGLHLLRQLVVLAYASTPGVEQAIGFDYTCRAYDEEHGR